MAALISLLAIAALGALAAWLFGSFALRVVGALIALAGLLGLATSTADGASVLALVLGIAAWLAGHWIYAARHHRYSGPLAERIFVRALPRRLDPTRDWAIPVTIQGQSPAPPAERGGED